MAVTRNPKGPLIHAELYQFNEAIFWDRTRPPDIDPRDDDVPYLVKTEDRLDLIAFVMLGSEQLGWVILHRNGLCLYPNDLVPGETIMIPTILSLRERGII